MIPTILALIIATIAFIESEKTQKLVRRFLLFVDQSKTIRKIYYGFLIAFVPVGLLYAFLIGLLKVAEGSLYQGIAAFLIMAIASVIFAFTSYKVVQ